MDITMQSTLSPLNCPGVTFCGCQGVKRQLTTKMFLSNGSVSSAGLVNRSFLQFVRCWLLLCCAILHSRADWLCSRYVRAEKHTLPKKQATFDLLLLWSSIMKHFNRVCVIVDTLSLWLPWSGNFQRQCSDFSIQMFFKAYLHFSTFIFLEVILIYSFCVLVGCCVPWSVFLVSVRLYRTQSEQKMLGVMLLHLFIVCRDCANFTHYLLTIFWVQEYCG